MLLVVGERALRRVRPNAEKLKDAFLDRLCKEKRPPIGIYRRKNNAYRSLEREIEKRKVLSVYSAMGCAEFVVFPEKDRFLGIQIELVCLMYTDRSAFNQKHTIKKRIKEKYMKTPTTSIIVTLALTLAGTAFAAVNPHEQNRQLVRGNGAAEVQATELYEVQGNKISTHAINRDISTASQREEALSSVNANFSASSSRDMARAETPFQRNRNS